MTKRLPAPTIAVVALILVAVLLPGSSLPDSPGIPGLDKIVHCALFLMLAVAAHLDFSLSGRRRIGAAVAAALAFAALTETLQIMVDGRSSEILDMVADMTGFILGVLARRPLSAFAAKAGRSAARLLGRRRGY